MKYTNVEGISLPLAVFLAFDDYDYDPKTISATKLMRPTRQVILASRVPKSNQLKDISSLVQSRVGQALHSAVEKVWENSYQKCMAALGYDDDDINRILINPANSELYDGCIPVYMENRTTREFNGFTVSGKYDFVAEGRVEDFKTTGVYTYIHNTKEEDYRIQGSIYRWLDPVRITEDTVRINFIFTDYNNRDAKTQKNYPKNRVTSRVYQLMTLEETEAYIKDRLDKLVGYWNVDEFDIPFCTDKELWRSAPVHRYYANPQKTARATRRFDDLEEAIAHQSKQGKGAVITTPGVVKACHYCDGYSMCTQKDELIAEGSLIPIEEVA